MTDKRYMRFLLLAVSGVATGLMLVFPQVGFLEWLTMIPAGIFLLSVAADKTVRLRCLYAYGLFFFMCYYLVVFHWFVNLYPLDFIDGMSHGAALAVVLVAWFGLSLLQALGGGLLFVLTALVFRCGFCCRFPLFRPFVAGGLWAIYEWSQNFGWWGVPWGRMPIGLSEYPLALQTASLFGSYGITFLLITVNFLLSYALLMRRKGRLCCCMAAGLLMFQYGAGALLWVTNKDKGEPIRATAVQGNISSHEKWQLGTLQKSFDVYEDYTRQAAAEGADLVVWPETALPVTVEEGNENWRFLSSLAKDTGVTVLVGAFTDHENGGEMNSIICFLPDGSTASRVYSKRRLVPFGEFVPMRGLISFLVPPLAELVMTEDDVLAGEGGQVFDLPDGSVGSLICFDSIYDGLTRESVLDGAELICLSTNDSWFTDSAALYMHNAQAQLRAIESGRYVVRAANTGISTVISPRGEVLVMLDPLVEGSVSADVYFRQGQTLYTYMGNSFVWLWLLTVAAMLGFDGWQWIFQKRKAKK